MMIDIASTLICEEFDEIKDYKNAFEMWNKLKESDGGDERRCEENYMITLDVIVGRLTTFELENYDIYVLASKNIESAFEAKISLKEKGNKIKDIQSESEEESKESFDSDLEVVQTFLARKYSRGRGKYKGKAPPNLLFM